MLMNIFSLEFNRLSGRFQLVEKVSSLKKTSEARNKSFRSRLFSKGLQGQGAEPLSRSAERETPYAVRSEWGEFKNSPVDCF